MFFRKRKSSGKPNKYRQLLVGALLVVLIPLALASLRRPDTAQAAWYALLPIDTSTIIKGEK